MLREIKDVRQISGEPKRRWFHDNDFDLVVWFDIDGGISGFQLCYKKDENQYALTWHDDGEYRHNIVDDGEKTPGKYKASPILIDNGMFHGEKIVKRFVNASRNLEKKIADFVYEKMILYPDPDIGK